MRPHRSTPGASPSDRLVRCRRLHAESLEQPAAFWGREAGALAWLRPPEQTFAGDLPCGDVSWFGDGSLNVTVSCVDRHAAAEPERPALVWLRAEGDVETLSYRALRQQISRMANVLLAHGVQPHDRVVVYLPMGAPLVVALLACARVGAVHLAVPARAEPDWLRRALRISRARLLVTANEAETDHERIPLWERADDALNGLGRIEAVLVHRRTSLRVPLAYARDHDLDRALALVRPTAVPWIAQGEEALLLAAAPGDDAVRPVLHGAAGFLLQALLVQREMLGVAPGARVLCLAEPEGPRIDVLYGALAAGATLVLDECGDAVDRLDALEVTHLIGSSEDLARAQASPGRPRTTVLVGPAEGDGADVETVWSSEGGGALIAHWPGSGSTPMFGLDPVLLDARGTPCPSLGEGDLWTRGSWPAQPRTLELDHARFVEQRLRRFPGLYRTGERCVLAADGRLLWAGRTHEPALMSLTAPDLPSGPLGRA
jgi:acetyl-CoA synthetase